MRSRTGRNRSLRWGLVIALVAVPGWMVLASAGRAKDCRALALEAPFPGPGEIFLSACPVSATQVLVIGRGFGPEEWLDVVVDDAPGHASATHARGIRARRDGSVEAMLAVGTERGQIRLMGSSGSYGISGWFDLETASVSDEAPRADRASG